MQIFLPIVRTLAPGDDRKAARDLEQMQVTLHPLAAWRICIVAIVILIAAVAFFFGASAELIGVVVAAGLLLVTYVEWMLGRRESSMDKFYERLEIANEHRNQIADVGMRIGMRMSDTERYIFTELDNLEYVIERYRFGYMSPTLAIRGVRTFVSRLDIQGFEKQVVELIDPRRGYHEHTCKVARKLIDDHKRQRNTDGVSAAPMA